MAETKPRTMIRRGRKFDQVLEGARQVFLRDGFEGASVDEIARAAGVSKATLYSYVPDKRLLFFEATKCECRRQAEEAQHLVRPETPAPEMLRFIGLKIVEFVASDFGLARFRIGVAEAARFPEIGREFYETGPVLLRGILAGYLRAAASRGELCIEDFDLAADQFAKLCCVDLQDRLLFGMSPEPKPGEAERIVDAAVKMFFARYGKN